MTSLLFSFPLGMRGIIIVAKLPFNSKSIFGRSTDLSPDDLTNILVISHPENPRSQVSAWLRPGLSTLLTLATSPVRGLGYNEDGTEMYAVAGNKFYEIDTSWIATERGTLSTSSGRVLIVMGEDSVLIKNTGSTDGYSFIPSSNTFASVSDPDFPDLISICYQDTYFIGVERNTGRAWISANDDPTSWDALDFATEEAKSDNALQAVSLNRDLYLIQVNSTGIWYNSGDTFPFDRRQFFEQGGLSSYSAVGLDKSIFNIQNCPTGDGRVIEMAGYDFKEIVAPEVTYKISSLSTKSDCEAYALVIEGQKLVIWSFPTENLTIVYNVSSGYWHKWTDAAGTGEFPIKGYVWFNNTHVIGDPTSGKIYKLSFDNPDDAGTDFSWSIITPTFVNEHGKRMFLSCVKLDFEAGGGAYNVTMSKSWDGGNNFTSHGTKSAGTLTYGRMKWNSLGSGYELCLKFTGTSNNAWRFFNIFADVTFGEA